MLDKNIAAEILVLYQQRRAEGKLIAREQIAACSAHFRDRFGPQRLQALDGVALLETMHDVSTKASLTYWLEFKADDEMPEQFGSIAGGSALKFGLFKSAKTGIWTTGSPQALVEMTTEEAVAKARRQREQLAAAAALIDALPAHAGPEAYQRLQLELTRVAGEVTDTAWGHKYLSLLYPDKLDSYHVAAFQRFHMVKLLQRYPETEGRYEIAGQYVSIASELGVPLNNLCSVLNERHGRPHAYWRIGTSDNDRPRVYWEPMLTGGFVAVGFPELGDMAAITADQKFKESLVDLFQQHYFPNRATAGRLATQFAHFFKDAKDGDIVLAAQGQTVLGIGKLLDGGVAYEPDSEIPYRRRIMWLETAEWKLPDPTEGNLTTFKRLKDVDNLVAIERRLEAVRADGGPDLTVRPSTELSALDGIPGKVLSVLERKAQVILYGPPGTGKTYWAEAAAREIAARRKFQRHYSDLTTAEQATLIGEDGLVRFCAFHPGYGYEDFMEGYRPELVNGQMVFSLRPGIFNRLCQAAAASPGDTFFLLIDEINRGDIPRIFGELLTLLEKDKRGKWLTLPQSGERFQVPPNLFVIGTMNTADRSIALLDTALRRRFGFVELMPDYQLLQGAEPAGIPLGPWLEALNERLLEHAGRDARHLQVGHAYFMAAGRPVTNAPEFVRILQYDVIPLLEEYCYEDYEALSKILGSTLIDRKAQRIRNGLFEPQSLDALVAALLEPCPTITASATSVGLAAEGDEPGGEADANDAHL